MAMKETETLARSVLSVFREQRRQANGGKERFGDWHAKLAEALLKPLASLYLTGAKRGKATVEDVDSVASAARERAMYAARLVNDTSGQWLREGREPAVVFSPERAVAIADTETVNAINYGRAIVVEARGGRLQWKVGRKPCRACVLGNTLVSPIGILVAARMNYDGPILGIDFGDGGYVAVTPNDEFLTPLGFVPAKLLVQGDDVLRCSVGEGEFSSDPDYDQSPIPIEDVFASLLELSSGAGTSSVSIFGEDFHGDASFGDGQVDIINTNGLLWNKWNAGKREHLAEQLFERPSYATGLLSGRSGLAETLITLGRSFHRPVGSTDLSPSLLSSITSPDEFSTLMALPENDFSLQQPVPYNYGRHEEAFCDLGDMLSSQVPINDRLNIDFPNLWSMDTELSDPCQYSGGRDSKMVGDLRNRLPRGVQLCQVRKVCKFHYVGPVFDLETQSTLYPVAQGVVKSNCLRLNGKIVRAGKPFAVVDGKEVFAPPLHPHCNCSAKEIR